MLQVALPETAGLAATHHFSHFAEPGCSAVEFMGHRVHFLPSIEVVPLGQGPQKPGR